LYLAPVWQYVNKNDIVYLEVSVGAFNVEFPTWNCVHFVNVVFKLHKPQV